MVSFKIGIDVIELVTVATLVNVARESKFKIALKSRAPPA